MFSDDETVKIWNLWSGKCLTTLSGHVSNVFATNFFNCNNEIISGGNDADVRVYDINKDVCTVYGHHTKKVLKIACSPIMPHCFYTCSADGSCRLFDVRCKYSNCKIENNVLRTNHANNSNAYQNYDDSVYPQVSRVSVLLF